MPYLGNEPATAFTSTTKDTFSGDASTTDFTMSKSANVNGVRVVVENVVQNPTVAYTCSGTTLSFTSAPPTGTNNIYVVHLGPPAATIAPPTTINNNTTFTGGVTFKNGSPEDTDGGRESILTFKGVQSGEEESTLAEIQASHDGTADDQKGDLIFRTNDGNDGTSPTEAMRIDSAQNVGIGTTSPSDKLHVDGASSFIRVNRTDGAAGITLMYNGSNSTRSNIATQTNGDLSFDTANTERMRIDSSGQVLIGTTTKLLNGAALELHGSGHYFLMRNTGSSAGKYWRNEVDTNNTLYIVNTSSAGVYIVDGGTSFSSLSDETLKENITDVGNVLDKVKNYRTSRFNWVGGKKDDTRIGFIAQDWETDFPEVVSTAKDDKLGLNYTETIPVLLKAIQELSAKVDALETENTAIKARLDALEA